MARRVEIRGRQLSRRRSDRKGFVLLLSLVVITVTSLVLSQLALHSLRLARDCTSRAEDLQRRWGSLTLQRTLLARAPVISMLSQNADRPTVGERLPISRHFELGNTSIHAVLDDENRKLNLNRLYTHRGRDHAFLVTRQLTDGSQWVSLRPTMPDQPHFERQLFESWGQVFDFGESANQLTAAPSKLTLWGSGRLNVRTASEQVLQAALVPRVRPATLAGLLELRSTPGSTVATMIQELAPTKKERREMTQWLADVSTTFSVSLQVEGSGHTKTEIAVRERSRSTPYIMAW